MSDRWYVALKRRYEESFLCYICWNDTIKRTRGVPQTVTRRDIHEANSFATKADAKLWLQTVPLDGRATVFVHRYSRTARIKAALDAAGIPEFDGERCLTLGRRVEMMGTRFLKARPEVQKFAYLMECRLNCNSHKPGWKNEDASTLIVRLRDQLEELNATTIYPRDDGYHASVVGDEAADVANFAMMVADVSGSLR